MKLTLSEPADLVDEYYVDILVRYDAMRDVASNSFRVANLPQQPPELVQDGMIRHVVDQFLLREAMENFLWFADRSPR